MPSIEEQIEQNTGLIWAVLHKFKLAYDQDAYSIGFEALWRSAATYQESKARFSTYATVCITNAVHGYLNQLPKTVELVENTYVQPEYDTYSPIEDIIRSLPKRKRRIMVLTISGFTGVEIAKIEKISQSYVSYVLAEVRNVIRKELNYDD